MTLGNKIQALRKQQSLSQDAFAEIMAVTRQSVSKWELDQSYPTTDKLVEIADFFNISLDELLRSENATTDTANIKFQPNRPKAAEGYDWFKNHYWYFIWWMILVVIIMILFGLKEYTAGFVISQILVWTTFIYFVFRYLKRKEK